MDAVSFRVLRRAAEVKPVIIYKGGITESGARAVASHTGAIAGLNIIWSSLLKQAGAIQVDTVEELIDMAHNAGYSVAFGIHHAGLSFPKIRAAALAVNSILTPINAEGVMMFPSQDVALAEITKTRENYRMIGIKCLAGGRIPPIQAFEYLKGKITDFMVGVASISELLIAFEAANKVGLRV